MNELKTCIDSNCGTLLINKVVKPLLIEWKPQKDITTWELAQCMWILAQYGHNRVFMPGDIDESKPYIRHWIITDPNKENI